MSECTHCSKMSFLHHRKVNPHCPQTKTCCLLIISKLGFSFQIIFSQVKFSNSLNWGVFFLVLNSHRNSPFHCCGNNLCLRLYWAGPTSLFEESPSYSPVFPQIKNIDICSVLHKLFSPWHLFCLALALPSLLFSLQIITVDMCALLSKYCLMFCISCCFYCSMYVQLKSEVYIHLSQIHLNSIFHNSWHLVLVRMSCLRSVRINTTF
jgi:hypothetical protein